MTDLKYEKVEPTLLRKLGLDERWLQARIEEDPSILGLGDLSVIERERRQPSGGRIDFLMYDPDESGARYEVEVMLGRVDESHIIRTIEYWDIERQRFPNLQHRAVLVAEDLTTRFLNVIALLNRAIPIVAIQLSAFRIDDRVVLNFTKLLDLSAESLADEEPDAITVVDRTYWTKMSSADSIGALDKLIPLIPNDPGVTHNKSHIAIGTTGRNFCWIHPRRRSGHIIVNLLVGADDRDAWVERLEKDGLAVSRHRVDRNLKLMHLVQRDIGEHEPLLRELMDHCESVSRSS